MLSVIILAAGKGTRMNDSNLPKVCRKVGNLTMIEHVKKASQRLNPYKTIVIVSKENHDVIKNVLQEQEQEQDDSIIYIVQEELNGTGSAVLSSESSYQNTDILVLLGDVPLIKTETMKKIIQSDNCCILGFQDDNIDNRFGRIVLNDANNILKIVEYNDATEEERRIKSVNSGILYLNKRYTHFLHEIDNNNSKSEYYLTDIIKILTRNNIDITYIEASKNECMGVNSPTDLKLVNELI